ncbi:MAG: zinc-dependent metalloprotease [Flavipsychrobacter sp.]|nr:zinc-dependent metalloprotease [Flavipsychrobacter sp.]
MLKKALLSLAVTTMCAAAGNAQNIQPCGTDEMHQKLKEKYPMIGYNESIASQVQNGLQNLNLSNYAKSTADQLNNPNFIYHIPVVVHIVHDYDTLAEYLTDDDIFDALKEWNIVLRGRNADTSQIIPPFKKYKGDPRIELHLATRDPDGNPTKGITRHHSYLTTGAGNESKLGGWPNYAYMNIWVIRSMAAGSNAAAFALKPAGGQQLPWYDGIISLWNYMSEAINPGSDKTIPHELAHTFNIDHVWGGTNQPEVGCGDDAVDDTPPTEGHQGGGCAPSRIYDTTCSIGYVQVYPSSIPGIDSMVDYPDTNNSQNIMDYTFCARMFTHGQVYRMHEALNSNTALRNNLWSDFNLQTTGALADRPDLAPIADFAPGKMISSFGNPTGTSRMMFMCADMVEKFSFTDMSWNDTIDSRTWQLSNSPTSSIGTGKSIATNFAQPGWVNVSLTVNSNAGSNTVTKAAVYAADKNYVINPMNGFHYQEFDPNGDRDKWPIFNYYNNNFKWQINTSAGYYDNYSVMYTGYDTRSFPQTMVGTPEGDVDDFFTPAFNLSGMSVGNCNLNYMFSGTALSAFHTDMEDTLQIAYSVDCGKTWTNMATLTNADIANQGNSVVNYQPTWMGQWDLKSINIPTAARTASTFFRFRYMPHVNPDGAVTSNNFYMDRINISNFPLGANTVLTEERNIVVAPNPTQNSSTIIIKGGQNTSASVMVTDITGKLVYKTAQKISSSYTTIEIPAEVLTVKGMYMIQVVTDNQSHTEKLVVY